MQVNQVRLGAVLSYVSMGLSTLISLIYTPIMLGRLGETEYGVYGAVGPIISYLLLLSMGLGSAYIRYYSQAKVAQDRREMAKLNGSLAHPETFPDRWADAGGPVTLAALEMLRR